MIRFFTCLISLLLLVPGAATATNLIDLSSSEGELSARLNISGDTLLTDDQGQAQISAADQLVCTLNVSAPENTTVILPTLLDGSFGDFTLIDQGEVKIRRTAHGLDHERQWFIEPYNPGTYRLPELLITARKGNMTTELILPRPEIAVPQVEADGEELNDILPPQAPGNTLERTLPLAGLALVILVLACLFAARTRNKKPKCQPPQERALTEMAALEGLPPTEKIERLAFILRCYLDSRFELHCLEQTYDEYEQAIAACEQIPAESRNIFLTVLKRCDLIKFSDISPEPDETETIHTQIKKGLEACPLAQPDDKTCGRW